jgi:NTE family protein
MNEISFNSSLMREMRAIAFVSRLIEAENLDDKRYKKMLIHAISNDAEMVHHGVSSKLDTDWHFLRHLFDAGRETADRWLAQHFDDVGTRTTVDLTGMYL